MGRAARKLYNHNKNRNFNANNNNPCPYCGIPGHLQGPTCKLWCKHGNERENPIVQLNDRSYRNQNQQGRPPASLNVFMVKNLPEILDPQLNYNGQCFGRWGCDCKQCWEPQESQLN